VGARVDGVIARLRGVGADVALFGHGHVLRVLVARWIRLPAPGGSREGFMETCVMLFNFTDQGIPNVKDITMQVDPVRNLAKSLNVTLRNIFWTLGQYDMVAMVEAR
jgi:broad specificity phosphatase PhoE